MNAIFFVSSTELVILVNCSFPLHDSRSFGWNGQFSHANIIVVTSSQLIRSLRCFVSVTDSPINTGTAAIQRKPKSNATDHHQQTKSCQNMKSILSPKQAANKRATADYSEMERNNIYAETPGKMKSNCSSSSSSSISPPTLVNGTNHYMPIVQQRRVPTVPVRNDQLRNSTGASTSSVSSFSTATCSSQSTTSSNSFRHDPSSIMTRSADASSACGLITQTKTVTSTMKSKSTYDIDTPTNDRSRAQTKENLNQNSKCSNPISNGNFVPLQSVKEDECLEVDRACQPKASKVSVDQSSLVFSCRRRTSRASSSG